MSEDDVPTVIADLAAKATKQLATKSKPMKSVAGVGAVTIAKPKSGGGKGLSAAKPAGAKRHAKKMRDNIQGITAPALRRLARRGGVKRMDGKIYEESRGVLKIFLQDVIRDAVQYTEHAQRKTVLVTDVVMALKRNGKTLYGWDS